MSELAVFHDVFPVRGTFRISRGSRTEANVVRAELTRDGVTGRGECLPYARYDETVESVMAQIESLRPALAGGLDRLALQEALPHGAARNALDCAFWDLEAKTAGQPVWQLAGLPEPLEVTTAYTISLDSVEAMGENARNNAHRPLLKLKLSGPDDLARVEAVRANAPNARIVVDANEGWTVAEYQELAPALLGLGVFMIEQPLPSGDDENLRGIERPITLCADESCHDSGSLAQLAGKYDMINIKLDKTGGLTEALALKKAAREAGFQIMVGCMLTSSLAIAPAVLVAQGVEVVDLDGPLLLAEDRENGLVYEGSQLRPPASALWG